jgi:hypothetical protein
MVNKKTITTVALLVTLSVSSRAQINLDNLNLDNILGKVLSVKKGFAPKFSLANVSIPKIAKVASIINLKNISTATKLFNTFKTGRTVYKIGAYTGSALTTYSAIRNAVNNAKTQVDKQLKKGLKTTLIAGGATMATGLLIKFLTKQASYKAVDAFNGVVKKKLKDILSLDAPTPSQYTQAGLALKISL